MKIAGDVCRITKLSAGAVPPGVRSTRCGLNMNESEAKSGSHEANFSLRGGRRALDRRGLDSIAMQPRTHPCAGKFCTRFVTLLIFFTGCASAARSQWLIQQSGTAADLRGIDSVDGRVAWASGTNGTILRTEDGGRFWQACTVPPEAEHLDFRGIQAFSASTAVVMSSGTGDLSRVYKATDGCHTWKLVFSNPYRRRDSSMPSCFSTHAMDCSSATPLRGV